MTVPFETSADACGQDGTVSPYADLARILDHAAHLLPAQGPIGTFVHHNTLHAFEDLPFEDAVVKASRLYGTEPFMSEQAFAEHLASGRIRPEDIAAVLAESAGGEDGRPLPGGLSRKAFKALRLGHPFEIPDGAALDWLLQEGPLLHHVHPAVSPSARARFLAGSATTGASGQEAAALRDLWSFLAPHAPPRAVPGPGLRPRDWLLAATGVDTDERVHALLIRLCGAFLDQGVAYWQMPCRERGLLDVFRLLYGATGASPDPWWHDLPKALRAQTAAGWDAETTVITMLGELAVPQSDWATVIDATLLSLRGWAGMISRLERRPDLAPVKAPPARLMDFLAVQLTLEVHAARYVGHRHGITDLASLKRHRVAVRQTDLSVAYEAFVMAQLAGIGTADLASPLAAGAWVREVAGFGSVDRRRLLHLAYERRLRVSVLDGLANQARLGNAPEAGPGVRAQIVFCMDDREESMRRHLEESYPAVTTYGMAGFFGVAMAYQGLEDVHPAPLCPVVVQPRHLVVEVPVDAAAGTQAALRRHLIGVWEWEREIASRTLVRGEVVTMLIGFLAAIPLIGRTLFPRFSEGLLHAVADTATGHPRTRLQLERPEGAPADAQGLFPGYTVSEMADVVGDALRTIGLVRDFAPLVMICGHGSSSLNNPHESAYDCGAAGGGRGGPNARAFAVMANHPDVRARLRQRGIDIPDATWFVGAAHNTSSDSLTCFDEDLIPAAVQKAFAELRAALEKARRLDAHERCRRFEHAPTDQSVAQALAHVETRAVDLRQPRPELGHVTNAVCVVGRRWRTRGLFMDRRAFLVSYDPATDPDGAILGPLLQSVGAVGAGINLEYYFSYVDPQGYGAGTKMPHNITGLIGVMDGHKSDLRTGLPWQMVEIHEPVRLLTVVEAEIATLARLMAEWPGVARLVRNRWMQLVAWSPSTGRMHVFTDAGFVPYEPESDQLPVVSRSIDYYRGHREHLGPARIVTGLDGEAHR